MKKKLKINNIPAFRRTLKSITNIPEMSLSPYILRSDMNLSEMEFTQKYYFSNTVSVNDFNVLVDFLNKQKEENKKEIEKAKNYDQITSLISQLLSLTDFEKIMENENNKKNIIKEKPPESDKIEKIVQITKNHKNITSLKKEKTVKNSKAKTTEPIKKENKSKEIGSGSTLLTVEASKALKNICSVLGLKSEYKQKGGLPISEYSLHYWTQPTEKGANTNKLLDLKEYLKRIIINGKSENVSGKDWNSITENWQIFNSQIPDRKNINSTDNKIKKPEETDIQIKVENSVKIETSPTKKILPEQNTELVNENNDFMLNHLELIKRKKEADEKLEVMLSKRKEDSYKRDRTLRIQDALKDMPICSTLAFSKEKKYSEKIYQIKDFTFSSNKPANLKPVEFTSENTDADPSENKLYLLHEDYEQYEALKKEAQKYQGKVEVKFILDNESKLDLYIDYLY